MVRIARGPGAGVYVPQQRTPREVALWREHVKRVNAQRRGGTLRLRRIAAERRRVAAFMATVRARKALRGG